MEWRVLIVDDKQAEDVKEVIAGHKVLAAPDSLECEICNDFSDAIRKLKEQRFDLLVLDVKNEGDSDDETKQYSGERVYEQVKETRFIPIVFHTGFAHKVEDLASPFVKVVRREGNPAELRAAINEVFSGKLPHLVRHIEEEQRKYMWESAEQIWTNDLEQDNSTDLAYLLSRRLANLLKGRAIKSYLAPNTGAAAQAVPGIHAVELYVWPPLEIPRLLFGDILKKNSDEMEEYFVVLTPSCDLVQDKADFILLSKCADLKSTPQWGAIKDALEQNAQPSNTAKNSLKELMRDNSKPVDRRQYLPGTSFLPDLVVDFQDLTQVKRSDLIGENVAYLRIASLDSPYAEELQAKMVRYYGRTGTPDLDVDSSYNRLFQA